MSASKEEIDQAIIKVHLAKKNSTHGPAPEASAARLLRLLRVSYSDVAQKTPAAVQASLISYLQGTENLTLEERNIPSIAKTVELIDLIRKSPLWMEEDKKKIFIQMESIAGTCPEIRWDANHRHWSTNVIYNPETGLLEEVMASPAETLNLVCRAILDRERYEVGPQGVEKDELCRVESLGNSLLSLRRQEEEGQVEFCAAGRQHEMLFLLDHSYQDLAGKPIEVINKSVKRCTSLVFAREEFACQ